MTRVATSRANPISWVTRTMVMPCSARPRMTSSTSPTISGSSADVASSNSMTCGRMAKERAMATRCFCPPDSDLGMASAFCANPTVSSRSIARFLASASVSPCTSFGARMMFSITLMLLNRLKCWNTMPTCSRTRSMSTLGSFRSWPATTTRPPVACSSPFRQRRMVDFPAPEGPMMQITSPLRTVRSTPLMTSVRP